MNLRHTLLALLLVWAAIDPAAQEPTWTIYKPTNTGLTGNYVYALALDADGAVWIGADDPIWDEGGLGRFDGDVWESWTNVDGKAPTHYMHDLQIDAQGRKWAASDVGLLRFDGDAVEVVWSTANAPWPTNKVSDFDWDSQGNLWVALYDVQTVHGGLAKYDGTSWTVYTTANGLPWAAPWDNVSAVEVDGQDRVWFGSPVMGGGMFDGATWTWLGVSGSWVTDIEFASNGEPWYVFANYGIQSWNGQGWTDRTAHFSPYDVARITLDRQGYLWVTTYVGSIWRFNGSAWDVSYQVPGLTHVYALVFDAANLPWVGGIGGLLHRGSSGTWTRYTTANTGLPDRWIAGLAAEPGDGAMWFAVPGGGAARFDGTHWRDFNPYNQGFEPWPFPTDIVDDLAAEPDGDVWIAADGFGVARWNGTTWAETYGVAAFGTSWAEHVAVATGGDVWVGLDYGANGGGVARIAGGVVTLFKSSNSPLPAGSIEDVTAAPDGAVWIATGTGVARYGPDGTWTIYDPGDGLPHINTWGVGVGPDGAAWVGTEDGLARIAGGAVTDVYTMADGLPADLCTAFAFAADGTPWVGCFDGGTFPYVGGVARFDGDRWTAFTTANSPLPHNQIGALAFDDAGDLWIGTQSEGVGVMHGAGVPAAPVAVAAAPIGGPITIPASGGSFTYRVTLTNTTGQSQTFQAWTAVTGPVSREPVVGPRTVTLPAGATVVRTLTQRVPGNAPAGTYTYHVRLGRFPAPVFASASFPFTKEAGAVAAVPGEAAEGWAASGSLDGAAPAAASLPEGFALSEASPNPFTGRATLTLEVGEGQHVRAEVYDALGRRVAVLYDGDVEAGQHVLTLDGSRLPAGVYVVRVTGETFSATRRVTLVR